MKKFVVDTNVFLRFLLQDSPPLYKKAADYFSKAQEKKIILILLPEVVFELDYVLSKVYRLLKQEIVESLGQLIKSPDLEVSQREVLVETIGKYQKINVDLVDLFIYETAKKEDASVLSFDKDFRKIE